jgi:uncharacterized membrane protein YeaQ/YmgE (transglycosylase-associated protein family)
MSIIGWLIIGLLAGAIARFLVPGRDPMGLLGTMLLGLGGSLVGGLLGNLIAGEGMAITAAGLLGSIIGAVILLLIYRMMVDRPRTAR